MKTCNHLGKVLGSNVRRLRVEQELTITQFSRMSGVSRPTIYKIESGQLSVQLSHVQKLAEALCVEPFMLFIPMQE